jgi:phosphotriesterase-related protein
MPHEHLLIDLGAFYRESDTASGRQRGEAPVGTVGDYDVHYDWTRNRDNLQLLDEEVAIEEAKLYRIAGGDALVEATSRGIGRDPLALQRIARATGLHIVMGAGYYLGRSHPPDLAHRSEEAITEEIVRDLREGAGETGVRAGVIGEIGCSWPLTPAERKSLDAAAEAARCTGAALMIHPGIDASAPEALLDEVRRRHLDLRRVVMCHIDRTVTDLARLRALGDTGCYLEYDHFGKEISFFPVNESDGPVDVDRVRRVVWLLEQGYGNQVLISQDVAFKNRLVRYGGHGYAHILRRIVPLLRRHGVSRETIDTLIRQNPARALAGPDVTTPTRRT